ncbi:MAG: helix-turn-helix domain-containing protein [Myxococcales bacterium]|nr:helix-turn-helix domain-containing protein [Myxococcales bacterium]
MTHFGQYIRDERTRHRISLRRLADALGVSHVFLGAIERGKGRPRKLLAEDKWDRLIELVPTITRTRLRRLAELSRVRLDDDAFQSLPLDGQRAAAAFARKINERTLSDSEISGLLRLLGTSKDADEE